jgi:hypothetical protein
MISKSVALGLVAAGCMTAAAGGAYIAVRQNNEVAPAASSAAAPISTPAPAQPVAETEAVVTPPAPAKPLISEPEISAPRDKAAKTIPRKSEPARTGRAPAASASSSNRVPPPARDASPRPEPAIESPGGVERPAAVRDPAATAPVAPPVAEPSIPDPAPAPSKPELVEVVVPTSSVVGLRVDTSHSSETARVEDRVEARVMRDVMADGRVAIPAGTRVLGDVVLVDRGGKIKDKARLGVRFHSLVLANGQQVPFRTDAIYREGTSPGAESARKIGGAAVGGAILGAIIGGGKGAAIGSAAGAAGGSAVVMAGDRNAATLPAGSTVTVRLNAPVAVDIEREF